MKKKLIGIMLAAMVAVCSSTSCVTEENVGGQFGNFIILEDTGYYNDE